MTDLLGDQCSEATSEISTKIATTKKKKEKFFEDKEKSRTQHMYHICIYIHIYIYIYKNYIIQPPSDISIIFQLFQA